MKQRRAFALLIALAALFLTVSFAALFARFSFMAIRAERLADGDTRAELAFQSAAAWLALHHAEVSDADPVALAIDIGSAAVAADLRVARRIMNREPVFHVELTLPSGASRVRRPADFSMTPQGSVLRRLSMDSTP
ncbi:MAG: hypothetical protein JNG88_10720 [Phycisphaerales bacterium]|nr:hypothetical protein [Phycisphaerales bacterium]